MAAKRAVVIPKELREEAASVISLQEKMMSLTVEQMNPLLEEISTGPFASDAEELTETVLLCVQFRPHNIDLYVDFMQLLCAEVPEARDLLLAPFFPERVKYFPWLSFMQKLYRSEFFTGKELCDRITEFCANYPNEVISRAYLFYYFAPIIQSENAKLYDEISKALQKSIGAFGVFWEVKEFITNLPRLSRNWQEYWESAEVTYPEGSMQAIIKNDDLEAFEDRAADKGFNINAEIKLHSYENNIFPEINPTLIEFAAYYGSQKIFSYMLRHGAEFRLDDPRTFAFTHFGIAGGFPEMTKAFEQRGCNYKGALGTAAQWHYSDVFKWIYAHKEKTVTPDLLFQSAAANNVEAVIFCLEHGINVNQVNEDSEGALHFAAKHGAADVARFLVGLKETDVNLGKGYRTPLHVAAFSGFANVVAILMTRKDIDINVISGGSGGTPLQEAAKAGHVAVVRELLKRKDVEVNGEVPTALQEAIIHGSAPVAVQLISVKGVDVNVKDEDGRNCLHLAAASGKAEIVTALLSQSVIARQITEKDMNQQTPLHLAAEQPLSDCISAFIDSGIHIDFMVADKDGNTPLHLAARNGSARSITRMLQVPGTDVNVRNLKGDTPLHFAAKRCRLQPLKALTSSPNLDVNARNNARQVPLHMMMSVKPADGFTLLLSQKGLDVNAQDENGETPLHIAAKSIHSDIVLKLLEIPEIDPNICDNSGQNAIHKAAKSSTPDSLKNMLTRAGIDVNKQDDAGVTPLHVACRAKESPGVQALLAVPGIQVNVKDANGQTPLHHAAAAGTHNIIRCLVGANGVNINAKDRTGKTPVQLLPKKDKFRNEKLFQTRK